MTDAQIRKCHERLERFLVDLLEPVGRSERRHWGAVYVRGLLLDVRGGEEGATFREPLWGTRAGAFPSYVTISERSSPSRVRFAAPNNGAPLTDSGPF